MAKKEKVRFIDLKVRDSAFTAFFRKFGIAGKTHGGINFDEIAALRHLLSNEKARILRTIQDKKPESIYELAKILRRDFKSVRKDVELLQQYEIIRLIQREKGRRKMLKPILNLDILHIILKI